MADERKMKFREEILKSGTRISLGRNAENNDELMKEFKGEGNTVIHTEKPGSPFCVIEGLSPTKKDIREAAAFCALRSQDWRDNKSDVLVHVFTGKEVYKRKGMKTGMFGVRRFTEIKIKKREIEKIK